MSNRSRCDGVRICPGCDEPFAQIVRVEPLSLRRRANASVSSAPAAKSQLLSAKVAREVRPSLVLEIRKFQFQLQK